MSGPCEIRTGENACSFRVKVTPRASRTQAVGWVNGALKIKVQSPPVEGAANEAVILFMAKSLGVPKSAVEITRGASGRDKTILVRGVVGEKVLGVFPLPD